MTRYLPTPLLRLDWLCLLLAMGSLTAQAHETAPDAGHTLTPILTVGARYLDSDLPWPGARLPGVLESGSQAAWKQGLAEDYADIGVQADWRQWRAMLKGSWHGPDGGNDFSIEQAWVQRSVAAGEDRELAVRAGRSQVPFGLLNREHAHNHDFGIAPLVYRAAIGDGWRDDGLNARLDWESGWFAGGGLYAGDSFPGASASGPGAALLQGGWEQDDAKLMVSFARLEADGRPTKSTSLIGHSHGQSVCHAPVANEVCLEGRSELVSLAGVWTSRQWPVSLDGEAWIKRETGDLFSTNGNAEYKGTVEGGWVTAHWTFCTGWQAMLRGEGMTASHRLNGPGSALVANEAGLGNADNTLTRVGLGLNWRPDSIQRISLEVHQEDTGAAKANLIFLTRYQVDLGGWLSKRKMP